MTEMVMSGSMSGEGKRSDGLLGERGNERRHGLQAPPALYATALFLDSTVRDGTPHRGTSNAPFSCVSDAERNGLVSS
jgi:hypothetical protein